GLKPDATKFCELVFDVNSAYFYNHGGYEFAKQFYEEAYRAAVEIVGGEQYILSAVMHADERNRAMSEALGEDVYHYHLHVVYIPVVEKEIRWSKRCKDPALRGTVKEVITQVSRSKKWASKPIIDPNGEPLINPNGKPVLKQSYTVLQDDFYSHMVNAGYTDIERGEPGSTEEHLTVTQFKVQKEKERLLELEGKADQKREQLQELNAKTKVQKTVSTTFSEIESIGKKTLLGKIEMSQQDARKLKDLAKKGVSSDATIDDLKRQLNSARRDKEIWRSRYEELLEQTRDFLAAVRKAPELVRQLIDRVLHMEAYREPAMHHTRWRDHSMEH
ncbi:MAG: plasmid recombination protein, partial [Firmicutes bacterium]|nr:plasmid recombination protein [Bacillota bacterium]